MNDTSTFPRLAMFALAALAVVGAVYAVSLSAQREAAAETADSDDAPIQPLLADTRRFLVPVTSSQPSKGPADALVTIVEWCDLRGAACREADAALQAVMKNNPGQVRWVHRHFFNRADQQALLMHHVARAVHYHTGKFWELRTLLLGTHDDAVLGQEDLIKLTEAVGVDWKAIAAGLDRTGYAQYVAADQVFATKYGVTEGPGILVNGLRLARAPGVSLQRSLQALVDQELAAAQKVAARGVAKADVYAEITRDGFWNVDDDPSARLRSEAASR